jgi:hypothetical protein
MDQKQREALRHRQYRKRKNKETNKLKGLRAYVLRESPELFRNFEAEYSANRTSPEGVSASPQVIQVMQTPPHIMQTPPHIMQTPQELKISTPKGDEDIPAVETWFEEFYDSLFI